jgi:hypothetical protein
MESSDDGGSGPLLLAAGMGSPGHSLVPAAVGGASSAPGASGSGGKPPVKRVMKTPYQLEVLERTYAGSSTTDDSECFGGLFLRASDRIVLVFFMGISFAQRIRTQTRRSGRSYRCS